MLRAGSRKMREISPSDNKNGRRQRFQLMYPYDRMNKGNTSIGEKIFGVRVVVREVWALVVFLGEALFHEDFGFLR